MNENIQGILLGALMLWSLFWKALALWHSAKNNQKYWFIGILILNTVGILELIYLVFFSGKKLKEIINLKNFKK